MTIGEILNKTGPRKLLALDGGGIRGMITLEVLAKMEATLRSSLKAEVDFVLADYFDYMAGTSTGAIIAAGLAQGMSVADLKTFYIDAGPDMFDKASLLKRFRYKFDKDKLTEKLKDVFGKDTTLGSDQLKTLLMMVLRNASTDSPWPLSNNPKAKYNDRDREDCNLDLLLWQVVRGSTAAPIYFPPEVAMVGEHEFIFVDGGVTCYNNPAFQLFLMSTVDAYKLNWQTGSEQMLLVSIGTGTNPEANTDLEPSEMNLIYNASSIPSALMNAALNEQDFLCRAFGDCRVGDALDREVGDMHGAGGPVNPKLFTYLRYNAELSRSGLDDLGLKSIDPKRVSKLDSVDAIGELEQVGQAVAAKVDAAHFKGFV